MKNLLLALFAAPLLWMTQLDAVKLIEVNPENISVDDGIIVDQDGIAIPVQNLFVRNAHVFALLKEDADQLISENGWIFYLPVNPNTSQQRFNKDVERYVGPLTRPMGTILPVKEENEEECNCGCDDKKEFVEVQGVISTWLKDLYRKTGDRNYPIDTQGKSCNCKNKHREKYYVDQASGDIIINISFDFDEDDDFEEQIVKIYVEDEQVAEVILEYYDDGSTGSLFDDESDFEEILDEIIDAQYEESLEADYEASSDYSETLDPAFEDIFNNGIDEEIVIGYDANGAYFYKASQLTR